MGLFTPDDYLSTVVTINPAALFEQGFRLALLDIDNTLVPRDTHVLTEEVKAWVTQLKDCGLRPCLLSNNWHRTVFAYAEALGLPIVYKAMKPLPFAFGRACRKLGREKGEKVVVIGDQLFTDVLGARLRGYKAILVLPQATTDLWYTQILRKLERLLMGDRQPRA
ncbi:MAG: YqeG family HAD IIIA-type phosphatase [Coriobacteriia bacterium]|nr:YqeG family HAD IIIA-type phosphatase [Coriobacteriia bacterium]